METNSEIQFNKNSFNLTGIVPVAGLPLDFQMDWHDCLTPIAPNYTMVEHAVYECAWAGCETIWVVCHYDMEPLIRYRMGDYIQDPVYANRSLEKYPSEHQRRIPIYYVPIHPKDRDRRDCLGWSVIYGALVSLKVHSKISRWTVPDKYYVSFPYGIFDPKELRPLRSKISSSQNFFVGKISDLKNLNHHTSFTFGKEEFVRFRREIRKGTGQFKNSEGIPTEKLPIEERYSARWFGLKDVFIDLDNNKDNSIEIEKFYDLSSWENYRNYLSSDLALKTSRPPEWLMKFKEFGSIALDRTD